MTAKNAEGYPDPTAEEAIRHVMRGGKLDYTSFRTYEELQDYTIEHNKGISTREAADKFIREKMPKESYFQKKILDWIKDQMPSHGKKQPARTPDRESRTLPASSMAGITDLRSSGHSLGY